MKNISDTFSISSVYLFMNWQLISDPSCAKMNYSCRFYCISAIILLFTVLDSIGPLRFNKTYI